MIKNICNGVYSIFINIGLFLEKYVDEVMYCFITLIVGGFVAFGGMGISYTIFPNDDFIQGYAFISSYVLFIGYCWIIGYLMRLHEITSWVGIMQAITWTFGTSVEYKGQRYTGDKDIENDISSTYPKFSYFYANVEDYNAPNKIYFLFKRDAMIYKLAETPE